MERSFQRFGFHRDNDLHVISPATKTKPHSAATLKRAFYQEAAVVLILEAGISQSRACNPEGLQESVAILKKVHRLFKLEKYWHDEGSEELEAGMLSALRASVAPLLRGTLSDLPLELL